MIYNCLDVPHFCPFLILVRYKQHSKYMQIIQYLKSYITMLVFTHHFLFILHHSYTLFLYWYQRHALSQKLHTFTVKPLSESWSTVTTTKAGSNFLSLSQSCSFHYTSLDRLRCQMLYKLLFYRCREAVNIPILCSSCMLMPNFSFSILALNGQLSPAAH